MLKHIKNIFIILLLFLSIGNTVFSAVYYVNLAPSQTYYYDPYKIQNNTGVSIFAPFSNSSGRLTSNFVGGNSFSFGTQLDRSYTHGGFTISNAGYSWITGGFGSCSVSCGGGTQYRFVGCKREDGSYISDSYCTGTKPYTSQSCNTQSCYTYSRYTGSYGSCDASPYWGSFGSCSVSCGGGTQYRTCYGTSGTSYRTVYCLRSDGTSVADGFCSGAKPNTSTSCTSSCSGSSSQSCNTQSCCDASMGSICYLGLGAWNPVYACHPEIYGYIQCDGSCGGYAYENTYGLCSW